VVSRARQRHFRASIAVDEEVVDDLLARREGAHRHLRAVTSKAT